jgi:hypothetical protein
MKIDIRIIITIIYIVINFLSIRQSSKNGGMYIPDFGWVFTLLISTICYLVFWVTYLVLIK